MNSYQQIAHNIYIGQMKIGDTVYSKWQRYLDAMSDRSGIEHEEFYSNTITALSSHWGASVIKTGAAYTTEKKKKRNIVTARGSVNLSEEIIQYCNKKITDSGTIAVLPNRPAYTKFSELMRDESQLEFCLNVLKTCKPAPIIGQNNNYLLGEHSKGSVAAWLNILKVHFLKDGVSNKEMCRLAPTAIKNFTIDERTLLNTNTSKYTIYEPRLNKLLIP